LGLPAETPSAKHRRDPVKREAVSSNDPLHNPILRLSAAAFSGVLLFASFPAIDWNLLAWIAGVPLLLALVNEPRLKRAYILGHLCGAVFIGGSCQWFVDVLEIHGGLNPALALFAVGLFLLVYPVIYGGFGIAVAWTARRSPLLALALSPFLWVALELGRSYWMTGFPWNLLGYAVQALGLRQVASATGVYGLSFLAMATSAIVAWVLLEPRRRGWQAASIAWLGLLGLGNWYLTPPPLPTGSIVAHLVQPNVPLDAESIVKWAPWRDPAPLMGLLTMTAASVDRFPAEAPHPPLIIWPENSAPFYFDRDEIFRSAVIRMARRNKAYVVFGTVTYADPQRTQPKNTAIALDPDGRVLLAYDKIHLVPFGEYVPGWAFPDLIGKITHEAGNFVPGLEYKTGSTSVGALGVFICYESVFPRLVRRLTPEGPGVLVNISNDAWFGDSAAAAQHLEMARLRAIESGRYLLRGTNDGTTAIIDPHGRVTQQIPRHEQAVLAGRFDYLAGRTFYKAHGDAFAWLCVLISLGILSLRAAGLRRRKGTGAAGGERQPAATE
jgi:apolipoprotein N-acyltransferase